MTALEDENRELTAKVAELQKQINLLQGAAENVSLGRCVSSAVRRIAVCDGRYPAPIELSWEKVGPGMPSPELVKLAHGERYYLPGRSLKDNEGSSWRNLRDEIENPIQSHRQTASGKVVATLEGITPPLSAEAALRQSEASLNSMLDVSRRSEERLQLIQSATGLADFEASPDGTLTCSERFFEQVGLPVPPSRAINFDQWFEVVHPEDRAWLIKETLRAVDELDDLTCEFRIIRSDTGEIRWINGHTLIQRDEQQRLVRTIGAQLDITSRKEAELALRSSEERLRLIQEAYGLADFENNGGEISRCSDTFFEQVGMPTGDNTLSIWDLLDLVHPEDRERLGKELERARVDADVFDAEYRIIRQDNGEVRWISCRTKLLRDENGEVCRTIGAHCDITYRKHAELALLESEGRFRLAAEAAGFGVWDYDSATNARNWSNRLLEIFGFAENTEASVELAAACVHPEDRKRFLALLDRAYDDEASVKFEDQLRIVRANDGAERWVALSCWKAECEVSLHRIILTLRDVTGEKTAEERIVWSANHDALTRLANRTSFQEALEKAIFKAEISKREVGLLLLDLDHFKQVNDTLGHDAGDQLLKMFADRLMSVVRPDDIVGRLGGDEFAIILSEVNNNHSLSDLSASIHERLREPFIYKGRMLDCRTSVGSALFPRDGASQTELMMNADMALYSAKNAGRSRTRMYEPKLRDEIECRTNMVRVAREAIDGNNITPYYQPKLNMLSREIIGFEALLRWRDAKGVIQLPERLEAAFENIEVATDLSDRMTRQVICDMRGWLDRGLEFGHVAVNASSAEFCREGFAESVLEQLENAGIPASKFQLEVTETVFLGRGAEYVHGALSLFSSAGVKIALDDFGTGYASLRHLKQFPVDVIKIDRSFVRDMETDAGDDAIVRAVIGLGRSLCIDVVAEGVEQEEHVKRLLSYGCNLGQGFLFSKAQPSDTVPALLGASATRLQGQSRAKIGLPSPRRDIG